MYIYIYNITNTVIRMSTKTIDSPIGRYPLKMFGELLFFTVLSRGGFAPPPAPLFLIHWQFV